MGGKSVFTPLNKGGRGDWIDRNVITLSVKTESSVETVGWGGLRRTNPPPALAGQVQFTWFVHSKTVTVGHKDATLRPLCSAGFQPASLLDSAILQAGRRIKKAV